MIFLERGIHWKTLVRRAYAEERTALILTLIFFSGILLSAGLNTDFPASLGKVKSFYLLPILFALALALFLEKGMEIRSLLRFWTIGSVTASIAALLAASNGWLLYDGRLAGPYTSANYLALLVAPGCLLSIFFFLTEETKRAKWLAAIAVVSTGSALFLTHSYATWAAFIASLLFGTVFSALHRLRLGRKEWIGLLLASGVIIGLLFFESGTEKWSQLVSADPRSSLASRQMIWQVAVDIATDNPWFGIGTGNFQSKYLEYQNRYPAYLEWAVPTPHNLPLHFWLEGGLLTILSWLGLLGLLGSRVWRMLCSIEGGEKRLSIVLSASLVLFYVAYGLVDTPYMKNDLTLALWGSIGLLVASLRLKG
ncbi:MAG: O-antigen ligase family protein [Undibacterium sp.]